MRREWWIPVIAIVLGVGLAVAIDKLPGGHSPDVKLDLNSAQSPSTTAIPEETTTTLFADTTIPDLSTFEDAPVSGSTGRSGGSSSGTKTTTKTPVTRKASGGSTGGGASTPPPPPPSPPPTNNTGSTMSRSQYCQQYKGTDFYNACMGNGGGSSTGDDDGTGNGNPDDSGGDGGGDGNDGNGAPGD